MSYLSRPRVNFFGTDAMTSPFTANNENVVHLLDYDRVELLDPPAVEGATLSRMGDAAYREWMTSVVTYADPIDQSRDETQPDWQPGMPGYWNYWGDHLTTFGSAAVSSVWVDDDPVTDPGRDPLIGARVVFNARIVDLNPADTFCSMFVAAGFSLVGRDASGATVELLRGVPTTSVTRWLNFFRPGGAGTFQAVIPGDGLAFVDAGRAPDSPGFHALRQGAQHGGGLLLRWCFYGMSAQRSMMEMYDRFQQGDAALNPKIGRVVGSIGVWNGSNPVSAPVGRILQQPRPPYFAPSADEAGAPRPRLAVKTHQDVDRISRPGTLLNARSAEVGCADKMGPAAALVEGSRVALDLNTAFPEIGCDPSATGDRWQKHDFGPVNLELVYDAGPGPQTAVLGPVRYDRYAYEALGGVWEVAFDPESEGGRHVADGWLRLRAASAGGEVLLQEIQVAQVVTDDQAVYLDLDMIDGAVQADGRASLRVFQKGEPLAEPLRLRVERWNDVQKPGRVNSLNPLVLTATEITEEAADHFDLEVPAGGLVDVPIAVSAPACYKLRYVAPGMNVDESNPAWAVEYYSCFRALPYDDYAGVPDEEITFEFVYRHVFSYYAILYPVMSKIIPWGPENTRHDPERVEQFAALIRQAIDPSRRGTALEMPITRELSAGKRALLRRWCDLQLRA